MELWERKTALELCPFDLKNYIMLERDECPRFFTLENP